MPRLFCGTSLTSTCLDSPHKVSWKARALDSTSAHPKGLSPRAVPKGLQDRDIADFSTCLMSVASPAVSEAAAAPNVETSACRQDRLAVCGPWAILKRWKGVRHTPAKETGSVVL